MATTGQAADRERPGAPLRKISVGGVAIGTSGALTAWLLSNADGKAWDKLIREMLSALWHENGAFAGLLFLACTVMFVSDRLHVKELLSAKNDEIARLVDERDRLQEKLGVPHPSSKKKGGGRQ